MITATAPAANSQSRPVIASPFTWTFGNMGRLAVRYTRYTCGVPSFIVMWPKMPITRARIRSTDFPL